jgi:hypothetical protein
MNQPKTGFGGRQLLLQGSDLLAPICKFSYADAKSQPTSLSLGNRDHENGGDDGCSLHRVLRQ